MRILCSLFILLFVLSSQPSYSYPIFYGCKNNQLVGANKFDSDDLFSKFLKLNKSQQTSLIGNWCGGKEDCIEHFKFIARFANVSQTVAMEIFEAELKILGKLNKGRIEDTQLIEEIEKYKATYVELQACQNAMKKLSSEDFITDNDSLVIPYPYHNNYMRITGCNSVSGKVCKPVKKKAVDKVITEATLMGTDPYLALALNFMEGQPEEMGTLYLDPIAVMDAIGCNSTSLKNGSEDGLNSYQTSYKVIASTKSNKNLSDKLKAYLSTIGKSNPVKGKSFYCYDSKGKTKPKVLRLPNKNSCCLELGFNAGMNSSAEISHALTYEFINKRININNKGKEDPSWEIQRFNGFTNLMGGAESVPAWRVGVNYRENPGYGQQAMDYIVNGLMFNPYIVEKIEREAKKQNKKSKNIICVGRENGSYYLDSDKYFNEVKNSTRLGVIANKFDAGVEYDGLTEREKSVINRELNETAKSNPKMPNLLRAAVYKKHEKRVQENLGLEVDHLFKSVKVPSATIWEANKGVVSKKDFNYMMEAWDQIDDFFFEADRINKEISKYEKQVLDYCNNSYQEYSELYNQKMAVKAEAKYNNYTNCVQNSDRFLTTIYNGDIDGAEKIVKEYPVFGSIPGDWKDFVKRASENSKQRNSYNESERSRMIKIFTKNPEKIQEIFNAREELEDLSKTHARLELETVDYENTKASVIALYSDYKARQEERNFHKAYDYYFEKIYKERKTLGQASDYSWKRLNHTQVELLTKKILKE